MPKSDVSADDVVNAVRFLRQMVGRIGGESDRVCFEAVMIEVLSEAPELLRRPLLPWDELAASAGLVLESDAIELRRRRLPGADVSEFGNDHYYDHMATRMTATEAKARLLALLDRVGAGEEIEITRHGRSIARLVPAAGSVALRGSLSGIVSSTADDALLYSTEESWDVVQ